MPGSSATTVTQAIATRLSVRDFLPDPVPESVLRRVLEKAARAPSGGNLQPWVVTILTGAPLAALVEKVAARQEESPKGEAAEYPVYPEAITEPYISRRFKIGEDMYKLLGIPREDRAARRLWFKSNFRFFDAPVGMFCFTDRQMGVAQFSDLGMFLQSVMLLLREEGFDSCPQEAWAMFAPTIYAHLGTPKNLMLFCGMAIGKRNPAAAVNTLVSDRVSIDEFATFQGFAPMTTRTRTIDWEDPREMAALGAKMAGLDYLHAMIAGKIPPPPIVKLMGITMASAEPGFVVMKLAIGEYLYNPIGSVHGGVAATLLDSVMGCAVHSVLPQGRAYSTLEIKISYLRAITDALGEVTAEGRVVNAGRKAAFAEGRIVDAAGKLYATGSTTCAVWEA